ncbi:MAG: tetratricopeptide repeat protein [Ktedonobacteraceae bacterium]|nr:tetratricopeptide repeat protein [Ktedonobacteraceae bacterium]
MTEDPDSLWRRCQADTPKRRAKFYGLLMLRSISPQGIVAQVLGTAKSPGHYKQRFGFLHTDYAPIFSDDSHQDLHPEIRMKLRQRLLTLRQEPEVMAVIASILHNQQERMRTVETAASYSDLRMRWRDSGWSITFLDLLEARFWSDPTEAILAALPSFLAASLYQPEYLSAIYELVAFFEEQIDYPQRDWWLQVCQSFNIPEQDLPPGQMAHCLHELRDLLLNGKLILAEPFDSYQRTFLAALWWQEGEIFRNVDLTNALACYHQALGLLYPEKDLPEHRAHLYWVLAETFTDPLVKRDLLLKCLADNPDYFDAYAQLGYLFYEQKEYRQALKYFHYALELQSRHVELWVMLGVLHTLRKNYLRALDELNHAVKLNPIHHLPYYNRADVYMHLQEYTQALADYSKALELDPTLADAYINRGNVYAMLKQPKRARQDYEEARRLQPTDMQALWLSEWITFGKQRMTPLEAQHLWAIAERNPDHYLASVCRGIFTGITRRDLKLASEALVEACVQEPDQWDPPFWLAMISAYRNRQEQARTALRQALDLGLPVALLQPLYWLERDNPAFFHKYALPILQSYAL